MQSQIRIEKIHMKVFLQLANIFSLKNKSL